MTSPEPDPSYREYGLLAWLQLRDDSAQGYVHWGARAGPDDDTIHLLVLRWLLWLPWYAAYVERKKAHEFGHVLRQDGWHEPLEARDLMSPRVWNARTDKHDVMAKSAAWRERTRDKRSYVGSRAPQAVTS